LTDLKAVLFDLDGTLFDWDLAQREALSLVARELPHLFAGVDEAVAFRVFLDSDRAAMEGLDEVSPPDEFRARRSTLFLRMLGLDEAHAERVAAAHTRLYPAVHAPVDGARSVVRSLAGSFQLGVVSNGLPDTQYRKLETLGVRPLFGCIVLSGEVGFWKPDPRIFWEATTSLGRETGECLYVGDSYDHDVVGAKRAGLRVCWLNPQGLPPSQMDVEPDYQVSALGQVLGILANA